MTYIDFVCMPFQEKNLDKYKPFLPVFVEVMTDYGLISYCEAISEDVPKGKLTDFYRAVDAQEGESVIACYMIWKDKESRNKGWHEGMSDARLNEFKEVQDVVDGKRMIFGGFTPIHSFSVQDRVQNSLTDGPG